VECIYLVKDRDYCRALVDTVMNLFVRSTAGSFLIAGLLSA
jgi:hypothetical protein